MSEAIEKRCEICRKEVGSTYFHLSQVKAFRCWNCGWMLAMKSVDNKKSDIVVVKYKDSIHWFDKKEANSWKSNGETLYRTIKGNYFIHGRHGNMVCEFYSRREACAWLLEKGFGDFPDDMKEDLAKMEM